MAEAADIALLDMRAQRRCAAWVHSVNHAPLRMTECVPRFRFRIRNISFLLSRIKQAILSPMKRCKPGASQVDRAGLIQTLFIL
jgi:hypothetical protein